MAISAVKLAGGGSSTAATTPTFTAQSAGVWLILQVTADDYRVTTGTNRPENTGWTLVSSGQDEIGFYVWTKLSTGVETSVIYGIGSASPSSWEVHAVSGATSTVGSTSAAVHTHGGSTSASGSATPPSGNGYAMALFGGYHSSTSITGGTFTNSYTLIGFQLGPTTGNREAAIAAGLATTSTTAVSTTITWTGAAPFCSYGTQLVFTEAGGGGDNTGTLSAPTPKLTASISGQSVNAGTVNASTPRATTSITGASTNAGATSASTPVLTSSIAGNSVNAGTLSAPVPRLTTSISDTTNVTGTLNAQIPKLTSSIAGNSVNAGTVNAQLIRITSTIAGNSVNTGALAASTPLATMLVAGTSKLTGTVLARTPLLTFYATDAAALTPLPFPLQLVGDAVMYGLRAEYPSLTLYGVAEELTLEG